MTQPILLGRLALVLTALLTVTGGCESYEASAFPAARSGYAVSPDEVFIYRSTVPADLEHVGHERHSLGQGVKLETLFDEIRETAANHGANVALLDVGATVTTNYEVYDIQDELRVRPQPVAQVIVVVRYGYSPSVAFGGLAQ